MSIVKPYCNRASRINLGLGNSSPTVEYPKFIASQVESYKQFLENDFPTLFDSINPIRDSMGKMWVLEFGDFEWEDPKRTEKEALDSDLSYEAAVYVHTKLLNVQTGEIKEQKVFIADVPLMTIQGYFIINGVKRVVTHQIVRAEGLLIDADVVVENRVVYKASLMPERGRWFKFETSKTDVISSRFVSKRPRILITEIFRVLGYESDAEIRDLFKDVDVDEEHKYIEATLARDFTKDKRTAIINIYNKLRPNETVTLRSAEKYVRSLLFDKDRFFLGKVGRYQLDKKLGTDHSKDPEPTFYVDDLIRIIKRLIRTNNGELLPDDVDHLKHRRIRRVGEILIGQLKRSMQRIRKNVRDKMSIYGNNTRLTPSMLVSTVPLSTSILSFFGQNQLSVFMEQTNILSELENKRKVTGSGPGGVLKLRAPFSLREVHYSQYSRFDPVTTPESQGVGVVVQLASFAKVNEMGFLEAPYRKVKQEVKNEVSELVNRILLEDVKDGRRVIAKADKLISESVAKKISKIKKLKKVKVYPYITEDIEYLDPHEEDLSHIGMSSEADEFKNIVEPLIPMKSKGTFSLQDRSQITHVDLILSQQAGVGMSLIPFVGHDESMRALVGANQQRQAVPLVKPEAPLIGTGLEEIVARQSNWTIYAEDKGLVQRADSKELIIKYDKLGVKRYGIVKFDRSNHDTSFSQFVRVESGNRVEKGDLLVDGPSVFNGELALGVNIRVALLSYEGYNYEDAVVISDRLVYDDVLTSVHIKEYVTEIRDTELGPEKLTADIPNTSDRILNKLDENGVVFVGARVREGDVLAGVVAPRGKKELTAEEKLLHAIFGESSSDVRDNSLKVSHGDKGVVLKRRILDADTTDDKLPPGVLKKVTVWIAQTKKISYGDKVSGRHGDKNTIAAIRPVEDMPFTKDGEPVDMILTPLFVKRMNMGQGVEVHFGKYAKLLGKNLAFPIFEKIDMDWLKSELEKKGYDLSQKEDLFDGRTGEKFPRPVTVGMKYILKLHHIAGEKVHARSTGPYTLVTQQPLGGKSQMGGQRVGEMVVWALEAHGAAYALQEMLTIKSDDTVGRAATYKAIIHGEPIENVNIPSSFKVLMRELNALCFNIELISGSKE